MASAASADLMPQSPADQGEKANGEGDLDYTITMNESEDEASGDDTNKPVKKENGAPSCPAKVNGKMTSDEDTQNCVSKGKHCKAEKKGQEEMDDETKDQAEDMETEDVREQEDKPKDEAKSQDKLKDGIEEAEDKVKEEAELEENKEDAAGREKMDEPNESSDVDKNDNDKAEDNIDEKPDSKKYKAAGKKRVGKCSRTARPETEKILDDDVVEIREDAPVKQQVAGNLPFVRVSNSAVSGAGYMPYISSVPGTTSLLNTSAMQLLQVQGGGLVYVPSNIQGVTPTATAFSPAMGGMGKGLHASATSVFMPHYANMMNSQNRGFMMSPFSQGVRGAVPAAPVLTNIPEKPTSSLGMIENIRWEVENHINIKPKYAKPNPKAELGHLAKWIYDLGSDLVKEFVYHDLVRIQHCRNSEGTLSKKEKDDFAKLQEIDKELNQKIGHLKIRLHKSCRCGFRTELTNALYLHQQHAHIERGGFFNCILCKFSTRQPSTFKFHMESMHARAGYIENRPSFFECPLCPYETNYTNRLDQHKVRCQRQFREAFNLHPSCVTGPEVNLCLENVFYYVFTRQFMNSIMPKQHQPPPVASSTTKIRDMPGGTDANAAMNMQARRGMMPNTSTSPLVNASRHLAPKTSVMATKTMPHMSKAPPRNFPVMSKMNVPSQPVAPTYSSGRSQVPAQSQSPAATAPPQAMNQPNNGFEVCEICGGYVKDRKALRIHFYYAHRIDMPFGVFERPMAPLYCATCFARFWTAQGLQKHIEVHKNDMMGTTQTSNGVAGKCISCGHRVPNILMHMRMVHNRELRHYLAALMCIFCGSRFSTKKEVETHMGKMHGVIVKNSGVQSAVIDPKPQPPPAPQNVSPTGYQQQPRSIGPPGQKTSPDPAAAAAAAAAKAKVKNRGSQCVLCNLSFNRNVDLTRHCMRVHHTCMKCGLVVVDKESLARHTCLHSASGMRTCQICRESGFHPAYYIKHMRDRHLRKCTVMLRRIDRAVVETLKRPITISDSEESDDDVDDKGEAEEPREAKRPRLHEGAIASAPAAKDKKPAKDQGAHDEDAKVSSEGDVGCEKDSSIKSGDEVMGSSREEKETGQEETQSENPEVGQDQSQVQEHDTEHKLNKGSKSVEKRRQADEEGEAPGGNSQSVSSETQDNADANSPDKQDGDDDSNVQEQKSDAADEESDSDKQCEDSSDRKNAKRKCDSHGNDEDSPVSKSRRTIEVNESLD